MVQALTENGPAGGSPTLESLRAGMALLMTWLSEGDTVPLEDPSASFDELAEKWLHAVVAARDLPAADRAGLVKRFFELLEANAEERWLPPELVGEVEGEDDEDEEDEESGPEFESAYEGMTYKDSADDGEEGSVAGGEPPRPVDFALEGEADHLEARLKFLHALAGLWRKAARPERLEVDSRQQRHERLVGADVGRGLLAADVLLARLEREREAAQA